VVANEACAAGLPTLVTAEAGAAKELIRDGKNGYVLPLNVEAWVDACMRLLSDPQLYAQQSAAAIRAVRPYNFDAAADGIWQAVKAAVPGRMDGKVS
jgi:glycosyltransferase involved in cell wall biosynthesis